MNTRATCLLGCLLLLVAISGCSFLTPPPSVTVVPSAGVANSAVTIVGAGFGDSQGTSSVTLDGEPATVYSWSNTSITARVPLIPTPGGASQTTEVAVTVGGRKAGVGSFVVVRGVLYCATRGGQQQVICLANPEGTDLFDLTSGSIDNWPQWSADGTRVAFMRGLGAASEIWVVNADGSGATALTHNAAYDSFPAWSPDDAKIAFQTNRDGNYEIYVMNTDGTGQVNLTQRDGLDAWPSWSPDGAKITFFALLTNYEVLVMSADGSGRTDISNDDATDWYPLWSPDGTRIAFQSNRDGAGEVFVMAPDGSAQANITHDPALDGGAAWSPDGSRIAFVSYRNGNAEIYAMDVDGTGQMRLTNDPGWDAGPTWSPDGEEIAFESNRDGGYRIYVMNADGTNTRRLVDDEGIYPVWTESRWFPVRP